MNIWYLNHYATPPDAGMPGRPYHLADKMKKRGDNVTVICASFHHLRQKAASHTACNRLQSCDGVDYFHLPTRRYCGNGIKRLLNMHDYARGVRRLLKNLKGGVLKRPDILIPSCVHHLVYPPALSIAKKIGAKIIYEIRDIWPLSLMELAGVSPWHPFILWSAWVEKKAYRTADAVVSLLPKAYDHMASLGLTKNRFFYIPNGIEPHEWKKSEPLLSEKQAFFEDLKRRHKLTVIYAGAHGIPNALDQLLDLDRYHQGKEAPYHFVIIGEGSEKEVLKRQVKERNISFISFWPKMPKPQIITALKLADVCFMSLRKENIFKYGVSPNKLGDYLMSGKPIIYAVEAGNNPVRESRSGISVEPYNTHQLESALQALYSMTTEERDEMGKRGRQYALDHLDWEKLANDYAAVCSKVLSGN